MISRQCLSRQCFQIRRCSFESVKYYCEQVKTIKVSPTPSASAIQNNFYLRADGPAHLTKSELVHHHWSLREGVTKTNKEGSDFMYILKNPSGIYWAASSALGLGITTGALVFLPIAPLYGVLLGGYFAIFQGFFFQLHSLLFGRGKREHNILYSPMSQMTEHMINYSLIINGELQFIPWLDMAEDREVETLTGYTALQQLVVKEPIFDRYENPRVVSYSSAKIIWKELQRECCHLITRQNLFIEYQPYYMRKFLCYCLPAAMHLQLGNFGIDCPLNSKLNGFEKFFVSFVNRTQRALLTTATSSWPLLRTSIWALGTGSVFSYIFGTLYYFFV